MENPQQSGRFNAAGIAYRTNAKPNFFITKTVENQ
jgi:hypothetical protein